MPRPLRWYDALTINAFWLALIVVAQANGLIYPLLVQQFVGAEVQGAFLGTLRLWTLMAALLWQAAIGLLSDHSAAAWGRRRPFILTGALGMVGGCALVGVAAGLTGGGGFWFLFAVAIVFSLAANTAHGAQQGLIPDLVPAAQRGRFSALKAIFEAPLPLLVVALVIAPRVKANDVRGALGLVAAIVLGAAALTVLAPERRGPPAPPLNWRPLGRLAAMTALFTGIILAAGAAVRWAAAALADVTAAVPLLLGMGGAGLLAMALAVALGVWLSVRISLAAADRAHNAAFAWWVMNRLAFLVGVTNLGTFAVYFLQARLGLAQAQAAGPAARLMLVIGVCILLAALPGGYLGDRFGHARLARAAGILAAAGVLIALLAPAMSVIYAGGALIGAATGLFFTSNWALGTRLAPPAEAGRYLGLANLAGAGAGAVGAYIGGPIADFVTGQLPGTPGAGYVLLFAIYGVMFLLSAGALWGVREGALKE